MPSIAPARADRSEGEANSDANSDIARPMPAIDGRVGRRVMRNRRELLTVHWQVEAAVVLLDQSIRRHRDVHAVTEFYVDFRLGFLVQARPARHVDRAINAIGP